MNSSMLQVIVSAVSSSNEFSNPKFNIVFKKIAFNDLFMILFQ